MVDLSAATVHVFPFDARPGAAADARRVLATVARLDPIRLAEAQLLVSELVANALQHGRLRATSRIHMTVDSDATRVRVAVSHESDISPDIVGNGMGFTLVEHLARRWGTTEKDGEFEVWFELRPAGTAAALLDVTDDEALGRADDDDAYRDEMIRRYERLATGIARRFRGKGVADADLEQVALVGLLHAVSRYDAEKGPFKPYAIATIRGALKRELRDRAWSVRVPRSLQELALEVAKTSESLSQTLGRGVTAADTAGALGISEEQVVEATVAGAAYQWDSIDATNPTTGRSLAETLRGGDSAAQLEDWEVVAGAMEWLPPRDRELLHLRFYRDFTQSEIACELGISQMQVSRLLARTIERLQRLVE